MVVSATNQLWTHPTCLDRRSPGSLPRAEIHLPSLSGIILRAEIEGLSSAQAAMPRRSGCKKAMLFSRSSLKCTSIFGYHCCKMYQKLSTREDLHTERTDCAYLRGGDFIDKYLCSVCELHMYGSLGRPIALAECRRTKKVRIDFRLRIQVHLSLSKLL